MKNDKRTKEYQEFVEQFRSYLALVTEGWGAKITFCEADGETWQEDRIEVEFAGEEPCIHIQRFHVEAIFRDIEMGGSQADYFLEAAGCLERCRLIGQDNPLSYLEDYEAVKRFLILRALNYDNNANHLKEGVYRLVGDIALALYVHIGSFDGLYSSSLVPVGAVSVWDRGQHQIFEEARRNTYRLFPPRLYSLREANRFGDPDYGIFMEQEVTVNLRPERGMLFVTTKLLLNGAVSIFLPGVARRIGELLNDDLYIVFTSVNEAVIHECSKVTPDTIRSGLSRLHGEENSPEMFLSGRIYYYSRERDGIGLYEE